MATKIAVSAREAGQMLSLSADTVTRLVNDGQLARVPHLGIIRIPVAELHRFAEQGMAVAS